MNNDFSKAFLSAVNYLPDKLWRAAFSLSASQREQCEEIRVRIGRPPKALVNGKYLSLTYKGELVVATAQDINEIICRATKCSVHTYADQINNGFVTTTEGHRIGVVGENYVADGKIRSVRSVDCINIRIAKSHVGIADNIIKTLFGDGFKNTLIVSQPGGGKTTLLRELARIMSNTYNVSIVDERYEIAGSKSGKATFDIGDCDIISGCSKPVAIETLIRSMSPNIIAIDEITQENDVETICRTAYCGCLFLATAHVSHVDDLNRRPIYKKLVKSDIFERIIYIENISGKRIYFAYSEESEYNVESNWSIADSGIMLGNRYFRKQRI